LPDLGRAQFERGGMCKPAQTTSGTEPAEHSFEQSRQLCAHFMHTSRQLLGAQFTRSEI